MAYSIFQIDVSSLEAGLLANYQKKKEAGLLASLYASLIGPWGGEWSRSLRRFLCC